MLGSGGFIPGFEEQLEGLELGESRTVSVSFPQDYSAAHLAGKAATFDVTLRGLARLPTSPSTMISPKASALRISAKLKESIKANIERDYAAASRRKWKRGLLDALDAKYAFDLPEGLVAQEFDQVWRAVEAEQKQTGKSFAEDGTTEEAARADYRKIAERRVRLGLLLADVGDAAGVKVSEEEVAPGSGRAGALLPRPGKGGLGLITRRIPMRSPRSGPRFTRRRSSITSSPRSR